MFYLPAAILETAGRRGWLALPQIAAGEIDVAVIGQLAPSQLSLDDKLELVPLDVEGLQTPLVRRRLIEELLEDAPAYAHQPFVFADDHGKLDGLAVRIPPSIPSSEDLRV